MATVLIMGASRGIGLEAVKGALEAGHEVRALARSAHSIKLDHPKLTKVTADAFDAAAVERALEGVDAVIQTLGVTPSVERAVKPTNLFSKATRVLVRAMEKTGVRRLIRCDPVGRRR